MNRLVILLCILKCIAARFTVEKRNDEKVNVSLYYESMCPYSCKFFQKQFYSLVNELGQSLNFHINPYGKATTTVSPNGDISFQCQHGPDECYCNQMHACAINILAGQGTKYVSLINCLFNDFQTGCSSDSLTQCANSLKIDPEPIQACASSNEGKKYLKAFGEQNLGDLKYVPTVTVNGEEYVNPDDLKQTVCDAFHDKPTNCSDSFDVIPMNRGVYRVNYVEYFI